MTYVFRIEDPDGVGPWWSSSLPSCLNLLSSNHAVGLPNLIKDMPDEYLPDRKNFICAVPDKYLIFDWFNKEQLIQLIKVGYKIRRYKVSDMVIGFSGTQCFFKRENVCGSTPLVGRE